MVLLLPLKKATRKRSQKQRSLVAQVAQESRDWPARPAGHGEIIGSSIREGKSRSCSGFLKPKVPSQSGTGDNCAAT